MDAQTNLLSLMLSFFKSMAEAFEQFFQLIADSMTFVSVVPVFLPSILIVSLTATITICYIRMILR